MLCFKSSLVSQPQLFLVHAGISNQQVLNSVGLIQRNIPVNVWFQVLLRTSSWKHKANDTLDCFIGLKPGYKGWEMDTSVLWWQTSTPGAEAGFPHRLRAPLGYFRTGQVPELGGEGWFIMWKKVRSLPVCSNQPNLVLIYENTPKHPLGEKGMLCFPDHRFPWWQVSHSKLYPQLCLWDFTEGFVRVREGWEYSHMQKHRTH